MIAEPGPTALTLPLLSTEATLVLLDENDNVASGELYSGRGAIRCCSVSSSLMFIVNDVGYKITPI